MTIQTLSEYSQLFKTMIVDSGFMRDVHDFTQTLPQSQGNVVTLRQIAASLEQKLSTIEASDLPTVMKSLLPGEKLFTESDFLPKLRAISNNPQLDQHNFFNQLHGITGELLVSLKRNDTSINKLIDVLDPYLTSVTANLASSDKATVSVVFKDKKTTTDLKEFSKVINNWSRTLPLYHQLIESKSPEKIEIVQVQNGSIDFVFNLDVNVAVNIAEIFSVGFKAFGAYIAYKHLVKKMVETYAGNQKLIDSEEARENDMLDNVFAKIKNRLREQHEHAASKDEKIDRTSEVIKIEEVTELVYAHIIKGNDLKLLSEPKPVDESDSSKDVKERLAAASLEVRLGIEELSALDRKLLEERIKDSK